MSKSILMIDNYQKKRSFNLIKLVMMEYLATLDQIINEPDDDDLFMKTTKNLINKFQDEALEILNNSSELLEIRKENLNILRDTLDFYWQNGKGIYKDYTENDFINAQSLLMPNERIFVKK